MFARIFIMTIALPLRLYQRAGTAIGAVAAVPVASAADASVL
jgi:hypothetical protein